MYVMFMGLLAIWIHIYITYDTHVYVCVYVMFVGLLAATHDICVYIMYIRMYAMFVGLLAARRDSHRYL